MSSTLFIGLMSGTSIDGVDAVLADFREPGRPVLLASASAPMPEALRAELLALNRPGHNELARAALAANTLAELYAVVTQNLLAEAALSADRIQAIGAHGQTVRHAPDAGYTLQLNAPALLAQRTGIAVIADFRSADVAAGGQGAPLVPAFHHAMFAAGRPRAVLNLGGIANVTLLDATGGIRGFDTGPANVLLDLWVHEKTGRAYDKDGVWARSGQPSAALLDFLLGSEPWFDLPPPKSTGRDLFDAAWLHERLQAYDASGKGMKDSDIQATLVQLTAKTVARAIMSQAPDTTEVLACGGGALNPALMKALQDAMPWPLQPTSHAGVPVQLVEALAFAWLAWAYEHGHRAGLPSVTGARKATILGCKYPA